MVHVPCKRGASVVCHQPRLSHVLQLPFTLLSLPIPLSPPTPTTSIFCPSTPIHPALHSCRLPTPHRAASAALYTSGLWLAAAFDCDLALAAVCAWILQHPLSTAHQCSTGAGAEWQPAGGRWSSPCMLEELRSCHGACRPAARTRLGAPWQAPLLEMRSPCSSLQQRA